MATRGAPGLEPKPYAAVPTARPAAKPSAIAPFDHRRGFDARPPLATVTVSVIGLVLLIAASCASRTGGASVERSKSE
jgi:hypothetical protein